MGTRSVLINLLGEGGGASRALRGVGDDADRAARRIDDLDGSNRRASDSTNLFTRGLSALAPAAGQAATAIAQFGAVVPAAAAVATTLVNIAPAAGVAATGLVAAGLAGVALKVGLAGVGDALKQAFGAKGDPEKLAAAMKNLSPNAREAVAELLKLKPALEGIKTAVQDKLFENLGASLKTAATETLPIFRRGLVGASEALNGMALNVLSTASALAKSGALGTAVDSATGGLKSLSMIPAQIVQGLVQVAAAAGPTFQKMTAGIAGGVTAISEKLAGAFKSGAMEKAINGAVALLKELVTVGANVGKILGNILAPMTQAGGGAIGVLRDITAEIAKITATAGVQSGLKALYDTMALLGRTVAPLLGQALAALGPVLAALGPPAQTLITALGQGLSSIITALGPVLTAAATAVGALVTALSPLLPVIGTLISSLLPVLTPFLNVMTQVFQALAPVVQQVADNLNTALAPILAALPGLAEPIARIMGQLALAVLPVLADLLKALGPVFAQLGQTFADLLVKAQPMITALGDAMAGALRALAPLIPPIIGVVTRLAQVFADLLASNITDIVIPAINLVTALLKGDASGAVKAFGQIVQGTLNQVGVLFVQLPMKVAAALGKLAAIVGAAAVEAMGQLTVAVGRGTLKVLAIMAGLPGRITAAIGNLGALLIRQGAALLDGLIAGVRSKISALQGMLGNITNLIPSWKGPPERDRVLLKPSGILIMEGLGDGLAEGVQEVYAFLDKVTGKLAYLVDAGAKAALEDAHGTIDGITKDMVKGLRGTADQIDAATKKIAAAIRDSFRQGAIDAGQRDGLLDYLANTNKKLKELTKERQAVLDKIKEVQDYAKQLTQNVLNYAAITNIRGADGAAPNGGQLVAGLQARLATIREFGANLKKLAGAGLSKALLGQILDAGIDGGAAIAAELANGPSSIITALNTAQTQITKIAKGIGIDGADALFGSGKAMGDAFLKGLKSLEKALVDSMEELVAKLLKALGGGVDKAKGKLAEMAETSKQVAQLAELVVTSTAKAAAYAPPAPKAPAPGPAAPKAPNIPAPKGGGGVKTVSVHLGGVTVKDRVDANMLMEAVEFSVRSAKF